MTKNKVSFINNTATKVIIDKLIKNLAFLAIAFAFSNSPSSNCFSVKIEKTIGRIARIKGDQVNIPKDTYKGVIKIRTPGSQITIDKKMVSKNMQTRFIIEDLKYVFTSSPQFLQNISSPH